MEDKGKGKKIEVSPMSSKSRWDTILGFITSSDDDAFLKKLTEEKEKRRRKNKDEDYEDKQILEFKKMGLSSLEGVKCFVQREMEMEIPDLNKPPPAGSLLNEVEGSCSSRTVEEEGFIPWKTHIPKKKRTMPREEDEEEVSSYIQKKTNNTSFQCLQGSSSTSMKRQKVEEHRVVHVPHQLNQDRQYYDQITKKIKKPQGGGVQTAQLIPDHIKEAIDEVDGTNITWLTEKVLYQSDIRTTQNRLSLPTDCYALLDSIMTEDEKMIYDVSYNKKGLKTRLIDPIPRVWDIDFKYWPSLGNRVFTGNWNKLVAELALVPGCKVQIWCFRIPAGPEPELCFAINIVRPQQKQHRDQKVGVLKF
ncbi:B3 domain-containing protein At5g24050-like [Papaver somniferum]|uniref:B3 domain-containing protein At5g24050-like n=1 Tax=Papaver somniferum TaxID=3469 RepID=UPI000E7016C2|nr:B3 domain-containing protein At5g24050-like [Papaver somniferum]